MEQSKKTTTITCSVTETSVPFILQIRAMSKEAFNAMHEEAARTGFVIRDNAFVTIEPGQAPKLGFTVISNVETGQIRRVETPKPEFPLPTEPISFYQVVRNYLEGVEHRSVDAETMKYDLCKLLLQNATEDVLAKSYPCGLGWQYDAAVYAQDKKMCDPCNTVTFTAVSKGHAVAIATANVMAKAKNLLTLHAIEQEGLSAGPKPAEWFKATNELECAVSEFETTAGVK